MERVIEFADGVILIGPGGRVEHGPTRDVLARSPITPPLVELGLRLGWDPLPLTIREGRRHSAADRRAWTGSPPELPGPATPGEEVLRARGLVVRYPRTVAVRDVDLVLSRGEVTALMGRNGSGKSTLLWALHGAGRRDAGTVSGAAAGSVSLVPQTASDLLYLATVEAECAAADAESGSPPGTTVELLQELVPDIEPSAHPRDLSEGQKLAVVLAAELSRGPDVILLDEPTRGLDYSAKHALTLTLHRLAAQGRSIVVATHDVELVAAACSRVVVMAEGEIVSDGPTRDVLPGSALLATQVAKVAAPAPLLTVQEYVDAQL